MYGFKHLENFFIKDRLDGLHRYASNIAIIIHVSLDLIVINDMHFFVTIARRDSRVYTEENTYLMKCFLRFEFMVKKNVNIKIHFSHYNFKTSFE